MSHPYYQQGLSEYERKKNKFIIRDAADCEKYLAYVEDGVNEVLDDQIDLTNKIIKLNNYYKALLSNFNFVKKYIINKKLPKKDLDITKLYDLNNNIVMFEDIFKTEEIYLYKLIDTINESYNLYDLELKIFKAEDYYDYNIRDIYDEINKISNKIKELNIFILDNEDYFKIENLNAYTQQKLCLKKLKTQIYKNQNKLFDNYKELQNLYYQLINELHNFILE